MILSCKIILKTRIKAIAFKINNLIVDNSTSLKIFGMDPKIRMLKIIRYSDGDSNKLLSFFKSPKNDKKSPAIIKYHKYWLIKIVQLESPPIFEL